MRPVVEGLSVVLIIFPQLQKALIESLVTTKVEEKVTPGLSATRYLELGVK